MPRPPTFFTALAGVPVQYDRMTPGAYGTRGVPYRFYCEAGFIASLEACFDEIWQACPLGPPEVITSAGAWVEKPGRHRPGRAFDLDGLFWSGRELVTLYDGYQGRDRRFYYAVECILRRHLGQVLNFDYNADHRDHFHMDHAAAVGLRRGSNAVTFFVQGLLRTVFERPVAVDGRWGNQTENALQQAAASVGVSDLDRTDNWKAFLAAAANLAFAPASAAMHALDAVDAPPSPQALLENLYATIRVELGATMLRKPVESALDAFTTHPDTVTWLNGGEAKEEA